jgi:hypothetical protein
MFLAMHAITKPASSHVPAEADIAGAIKLFGMQVGGLA